MNIREATAEDAALISHIIAASWRHSYQGLVDPVYLSRLPEDYWLIPVRSWLGSGRMYGYIAQEDDDAIGCIICGRGRDESHADWGEIVSLYVRPDRTGRGVGSRLLSAALNCLHEEGYHRVYLWAIDGNVNADAFYRRRGFCRTDECEKYKIGQKNMLDVLYVLDEPT